MIPILIYPIDIFFHNFHFTMVHETPIPITPVSRKSFALEFKCYAVRYIDKAVEEKMASVTVACDAFCIPHYYNAYWKKTLHKVDDLLTMNEFVA